MVMVQKAGSNMVTTDTMNANEANLGSGKSDALCLRCSKAFLRVDLKRCSASKMGRLEDARDG